MSEHESHAHHPAFYETGKKEIIDIYKPEKERKRVYLDHVRTSSGVRFRGYWRWVDAYN